MTKKTEETTKCFSFKVTMIIQVLADNDDEAKARLDKDGGVVTRREILCLDSIKLHNEWEKNNGTFR